MTMLPSDLPSEFDWDLFAEIARITRWLDESNRAVTGDDAMRVLKVSEEIREFTDLIIAANGRAAAAYIGMTGQNPRKGTTHTRNDLLRELADVAVTALCAIQHFTQSPDVTRAFVAEKTHAIIARSHIK